MPDIEKLIERAIFTPEALTDLADIKLIVDYFGYHQRKSKGGHVIFSKSSGQSIIIPTVSGRHVKRQYIKYVVEQLDLEVWYERRKRTE